MMAQTTWKKSLRPIYGEQTGRALRLVALVWCVSIGGAVRLKQFPVGTSSQISTRNTLPGTLNRKWAISGCIRKHFCSQPEIGNFPSGFPAAWEMVFYRAVLTKFYFSRVAGQLWKTLKKFRTKDFDEVFSVLTDQGNNSEVLPLYVRIFVPVLHVRQYGMTRVSTATGRLLFPPNTLLIFW